MADDFRTLVPRYHVQRLAQLMELKLQENDGKGGWDDCGTQWLLGRLDDEIKELQEAIKAKKDPLAVAREAADAANFLMMIVDCYSAQKTGGDWL